MTGRLIIVKWLFWCGTDSSGRSPVDPTSRSFLGSLVILGHAFRRPIRSGSFPFRIFMSWLELILRAADYPERRRLNLGFLTLVQSKTPRQARWPLSLPPASAHPVERVRRRDASAPASATP